MLPHILCNVLMLVTVELHSFYCACSQSSALPCPMTACGQSSVWNSWMAGVWRSVFFLSCTRTWKGHEHVKRTWFILRNSNYMVVDWVQLCQTKSWIHTHGIWTVLLGMPFMLHCSHTMQYAALLQLLLFNSDPTCMCVWGGMEACAHADRSH